MKTKQPQTFDLASLDTIAACDAGAEIELLHPVSKEPLGIFISVYGKDSTVFKEHTRQTLNAKLRREGLNRQRGRNAELPTVEGVEEEGTTALVVCTRGWRTGDKETGKAAITFKGEDLPFTVANARILYTALPWIRKQVDEGIGDLENFLTA